MIKDSLIAIGRAARELLRGWGALGVLSLLYAALLASLYLFLWTREATAWQLALTAVWAVAAPLLFFILQAGAARFAAGATRPGALLRGALRDFLKILLLSLPLIALAVLIFYLMNRLQARFPVAEASSVSPSHTGPFAPATGPAMPWRWTDVLFTTLRLLLLGVLLPLIAVEVWLAVARDGLLGTLKRLHRVVGRAFAPQPLFVYALGLFVFGLIPYLLLFTRTPVTNAWLELILFGVRLGLAFVFTLWGWLVTLGALARINGDAATPGAVAPVVVNAPGGEELPAAAQG